MGQLYKAILKPILRPVYLQLESNRLIRKFAEDNVYRDAKHADYFVLSVLAVINCCSTISFMFYWQLRKGSLPFWLIFIYYCTWVGIGGNMMGAAYGIAHREVSLIFNHQ